MDLTLLLTNRCNARCAHCITCSSPEISAPPLALDEIRDWIDQAKALSKRRTQFSVCVVGGEPFLYPDTLLEVVRYASTQGAKTTCVTNAFWADSYDKALATVKGFKNAGLAGLCLSHDQFHQAYVPFRNIATALKACSAVHLGFSLKYVLCRGAPRMTSMLGRLESITVNQTFSVSEILCMPLGRAKTLPARRFIYRKTLPSGRCAWLGALAVNESGKLYPCCTPDWPSLLCLGDLRSEKLGALIKRAKRNPLLLILNEHGPAYFVPFMNEAGIRFPRGSFVNECHLCNSVLKTATDNPKAREAFGQAIRHWKIKKRDEQRAAALIHKMLSS